MDRTELAELLLAYLYDCAENAGHSYYFFRLNEFAGKLGVSGHGEVMAAGQILESRGLVLLSLEGAGGLSALITDDGCVFVEKGGETGVIAKFRSDPASFTGQATSASDELARNSRRMVLGNEIYGILTDMEEVLRRDESIEGALRETSLHALELITQQLGFATGDVASLHRQLDQIDRIPGLAPLTAKLKVLVDEYMA
jgi:hypothetical protein